jgi:hypothetical protein
MRGQSLACSVAETLPSCSPLRLLSRLGSVRQSPFAFLPARSHRLGTAFRSPATTVLFREPPWRGQRSWPIPSALIPNSFSSPFGLGLPPSATFFTSPGAFRAQNPLPYSKLETLKRPSNFRSPPGLSSLGIGSARSAAESEKLTFVPGPFSLRSPKALITFDNYPLSDHRSRFASVHQAFCSLNLLEPRPYCPESPFQSMIKCLLQ